VQDALITVLSERPCPSRKLGDEAQAVKGFNLIATANDRDRGVNDLSAALRRRFNTVVLRCRSGRRTRCGSSPPGSPTSPPRWSFLRCPRRWRRSVGWSRSSGAAVRVTKDGRTTIKSPSGTLSAAEAISVITSGLACRALR
jgi:hypothetical protein